MIKTVKTDLYHGDYINKRPNFTGCVIDVFGNKYYYKNGLCHRGDGPAVEHADGYKAYYKNGLRHRENGPAIEYADGTESYWLNNKSYSYEIWKRELLKIKLKRTLLCLGDK